MSLGTKPEVCSKFKIWLEQICCDSCRCEIDASETAVQEFSLMFRHKQNSSIPLIYLWGRELGAVFPLNTYIAYYKNVYNKKQYFDVHSL